MRFIVDKPDLYVIHGDCRDVIAAIDPATISLVLTDPPYGVGYKHENKQRNRGGFSQTLSFGKGSTHPATNYPPVIGDDKPFDPSPLLVFPRLVLFGANYYAERLPPSPSWFVWDKLNGLTTIKREIGFNDSADIELAWSNLGGPARIIPHRWNGLMKDSEHGERRVHPTQKPIALMRAFIEHYTQPGEWIFDPYGGSGSTAIAARECGRPVIISELSEDYATLIARRLAERGFC